MGIIWGDRTTCWRDGLLWLRLPRIQGYMGSSNWGSAGMHKGTNQRGWQVRRSGTERRNYHWALTTTILKVCSLFLWIGSSTCCTVTGSRRMDMLPWPPRWQADSNSFDHIDVHYFIHTRDNPHVLHSLYVYVTVLNIHHKTSHWKIIFA